MSNDTNISGDAHAPSTQRLKGTHRQPVRLAEHAIEFVPGLNEVTRKLVASVKRSHGG